jgi:Rad3-related DNA helicase
VIDRFCPSPVEWGAPSKFASWRDNQDTLFWDILDSKKRFSIHCAPVGCHARGTGILMYDGSVKPVEDIAVGDVIIGPDSNPRVVKEIHTGTEEMFRISPHRGAAAFDVSASHILHLVKTREGIERRAGRKRTRKRSGPDVIDISVREYVTKSQNFKKHYKLVRSGEVRFAGCNEVLSIDPYFLGVYLGDGCSSSRGTVSVSSADSEIVDAAYTDAAERGMRVRCASKPGNVASDYYITNKTPGNRYRTNGLRDSLRTLRLCGLRSGDKFIPEEYKFAATEIRAEVLAGLLDTDGSLGSSCFDLTLKSRLLLDDAIFVARSMGLTCAPPYQKIVMEKVYWRTTISGNTDIIPTRVCRKRASPRSQKKNPLRSGFVLDSVGVGTYYGFSVDADNLYLTADFIIHHNSGKSLAYITAALALGKRVAVLTESKGLMDQASADFKQIGLFDMRGLANYTCHALERGGIMEERWNKRWGRPTCDMGPCTAGLRCELKQSGCDYFDDYRRACAKQLVMTNNAYWIAIHKYGQGLGDFDALFIDEAHAVDGALNTAIAVEFTKEEFAEIGSKHPKITDPLVNWRTWGRTQLSKIEARLEFFANSDEIGRRMGPEGVLTLVNDTDLPDASELKMWKQLETKFKTLSNSTDKWVIERTSGGNIRISPVWVRHYAESHLFRGIPRVAFFSATVRPKIADLLGIPDGDWEFREYPSTFPVERRPLYWVPTVALSHESDASDLRTWVVRIDNIIAGRLDRKGIIHTRSFKLQQLLKAQSRFSKLMMVNVTGNTRDVVQSFKEADAPAILVSPSVGTGYDFPGDLARYQIIGKVPYVDKRGAIIQAQLKEDPKYADYLTSQDLIQIYGRSNRAPDDFSETFCVDDCIRNFVKYNKNLFPEYFLEAFQPVERIPDPPLLEEISC